VGGAGAARPEPRRVIVSFVVEQACARFDARLEEERARPQWTGCFSMRKHFFTTIKMDAAIEMKYEK
jgi:hypothetical protein